MVEDNARHWLEATETTALVKWKSITLSIKDSYLTLEWTFRLDAFWYIFVVFCFFYVSFFLIFSLFVKCSVLYHVITLWCHYFVLSLTEAHVSGWWWLCRQLAKLLQCISNPCITLIGINVRKWMCYWRRVCNRLWHVQMMLGHDMLV